MRFARYLLIAVTFLLGLTQLTYAQDDDDCALGIKYVYVLNAASGTLEKDKDSDDADAYTLTIHNVEKDIDWLKARPFRRAGTITVADFVRSWDLGKGSFADDPPNALLVSKSFIPLGIFGGAEVYSFVISNPRYDDQEKTLIFDARHIPGTGKKQVKEGIYRNLSVTIAD